LSTLEATRPFAAPHGHNEHGIRQPSVQSGPMLKATGFLVLYNLAEASMRDGVTAIHDAMKSTGVSFDQLRPDLRRVIAKNAVDGGVGQLAHFTDLATDIVCKTFDATRVFSGNVDAKAIREVARKYGFDHRVPDQGGAGDSLLMVKTARNDLGHGIKSFVEVGREHSVADMLRTRDDVVRYLRAIVSNIAVFIENRGYLAASPTVRGLGTQSKDVAK